jgi:hypothetical protein
MAITTYYGNSNLRTFLDYGEKSADGYLRNVQRHLEGQEAYDQWHLALYIKDYLRCLDVLRQSEIRFDQIPRPDKNVLGYLFAQCIDNFESVCELGSTLFEVIDGFRCTEKWLAQIPSAQSPLLALEKYQWLGVEISAVFRNAAELLHPDQNIRHVISTDDISEPVSLMLDRSVSNYCYGSSAEFASAVNRSGAAFLNTYFSLEETFYSTRYAKQLTYFSLKEFLANSELEVFHLYGRTAPRPAGDQDLAGRRPVIEGFWFIGDPKVLDRFKNRVESLPEVRDFLLKRDFAVTPAKKLLDA